MHVLRLLERIYSAGKSMRAILDQIPIYERMDGPRAYCRTFSILCRDIRHVLPMALWTTPTGPFMQNSILCNVQHVSI